MLIDIIDTLDGLTKLKADWNAAYDKDPDGQIFLSWDWIYAWFRRMDCPWSILCAKPAANAPYVAFLPLQHRWDIAKDGTLYNETKPGGAEFADYTGIVCDPAYQDEAVPALADRLLDMRWMKLTFNHIRASEKRYRLFIKAFERPKLDVEPVIRWIQNRTVNCSIFPYAALPGDWDTYCNEKLSTNTRQKARRFLKRLDEGKEFRVTHSTKETIDTDIGLLLMFWEIKWSKEKGTSLANIIKNNRTMLRRAFDFDSCTVPILWTGERPLAAHGMLLEPKRKVMRFLIGGRDETFTSPPPSFLLHMHTIRWAIREGYEEYDLLQGNEKYKYMFGVDERTTRSVVIRTKTRRNLGDLLEPWCIKYAIEKVTELHKQGKLREAAIGYQQIIDTDPKHTGALYLYAQLEAVRANHEAAEKLFKAYLSIKPRSADGWLRLAKVQEAQGKAQEAIASFRKVAEIEPGNSEANAHLTQLSPLDDLLSTALGPRPKWMTG